MSVLDNMIKELDEQYITKNVGLKHDEARMKYRLESITVNNDSEFDDLLADYYNYHFSICISEGGSLSRAEAAGRAKEIIERDYRRHGKDKLEAYRDGKEGTNGGMRAILDIIMEHLKAEAIEYHVRDVFDRFVAPSNWEEHVAIVKELLTTLKNTGATNIDFSDPERYAKNYEELIRAFTDGLQRSSARLRRL